MKHETLSMGHHWWTVSVIMFPLLILLCLSVWMLLSAPTRAIWGLRMSCHSLNFVLSILQPAAVVTRNVRGGQVSKSDILCQAD